MQEKKISPSSDAECYVWGGVIINLEKKNPYNARSKFIRLIFLLVINPFTASKVPYSEFFWSLFSTFRTGYGEIQSILKYSVQMWENKDKKNSQYGHFSRSASQAIP